MGYSVGRGSEKLRRGVLPVRVGDVWFRGDVSEASRSSLGG
jgi:hypothetical protein